MPTLYRLSTATICPSIRPEPFGRTAAEASAMGSIVLGSDQGGTQEIVEHDKTGFLFPPEDSIKLAELMDKVLDMTAAERQTLKQNAINRARERFDNETMLAKTLRVYQKFL